MSQRAPLRMALMSQSGLALCCASVTGTQHPPHPPSHCRRRLPLHNIMTVSVSCYTSHTLFLPLSPQPHPPPPQTPPPPPTPPLSLWALCQANAIKEKKKKKRHGEGEVERTGWRMMEGERSSTWSPQHTFLKANTKLDR